MSFIDTPLSDEEEQQYRKWMMTPGRLGTLDAGMDSRAQWKASTLDPGTDALALKKKKKKVIYASD